MGAAIQLSGRRGLLGALPCKGILPPLLLAGMNTKPDPSDQDWESLAEDLLGVDLTRPPAIDEPFEVEDFDLVETSDDDPSDIDDDSPVTAEEMADDLEDDADLATEDVEAEGASDEADDDYWDALDGWDWDEPSSDSAKPPRSVFGGVSAGKTEPAAPPKEAPRRPKTEKLIANDDFGVGVVEVDVPSPAEEPVDEKSETPRRGRRRGGRRRSRRKEGSAQPDRVDRTPKADSGRDEAGDLEDDDDDGMAASDRPAAESADDSVDDSDGFGAGLELEVKPAEEKRPRSRRRGRRRRKSTESSTSESSQTKATPQSGPPEDDAGESASADEDVDADAADDDDSTTEEGVSQKRYRSVPTWEQAISYLVKVPPRGGNPSGESGGGSGRSRGGGGSRRGSGRRGGGRGQRSG